jgi:PAS domain S-box-containing protein
MQKIKFSTDEVLRLEALESYSILDTYPEEEFDRITELASLVCGVKISLISLLDSERQWFKSKVGIDVAETPKNISFCQFAIQGTELYEVEDASKTDLFKNNPLVTGNPNIRFYAGHPLTDSNGFNLGTLCVIDPEPKKLTATQVKSLALLAESLMDLIEKRKKLNTYNENNHELNKRLSYVLNATGDGVWDWCPETGKSIYSKKWAEMLGYSIDELSDSDTEWSSRIHPDDRMLAFDIIGKNVSGEEDSFSFEYQFKHKDGSFLTILNRGSVVERDEKGMATRVIGSHTDLSEKRNKELENQLKIHHLQNFFDLNIDFLCIANVNGTFKDVNDTFSRELGFAKADFINTPFTNFIHPDDLESTFLEVKRLSEGRSAIDFENRYVCKDGSYIWLSWRASPDKETGDLFCVARNVTKQKESLKQIGDLKQALDESSIVVTTDKNGVILSVNEKFCEISQFSREELIGKDHRIINSKYHSKAFIKNLWTTISSGKTWKGEMRNKAKDGSFYWVDTTILPFLDNEGIPYQYIAVRNDITVQKEIEEDLNHAKDQAELSMRTKEQFLANMSHEIRTPMNGIVGFAKILSDELTDPEHKICADSIINSGENLMVIINDILDFSKIEADKMTIEQAEFSISKSVQDVIDLFIPKCKEKGIFLIYEPNNKIPDLLLGDTTRLSQILINLIGNAVKFTESGHVELVVVKEKETVSNVSLKFSIADSGIGIPASKLESIFDSFTQASASTTRKFGGSGLGLTITKKLIELQGGALSVKSEDGKGSEFTFTIDYLKVKKNNMESKIINDDKELTPDFLVGKKILMVEDNPLNQQLGHFVFKRWGQQVHLAENGKIAIEMLEKEHFDLILMDIQMPVMDGNDATRYIREKMGEKSQIPIIALTAHATIGEEKRCLDQGMDDYLSKPFNATKLLEKIYQNLQKSQNPIY